MYTEDNQNNHGNDDNTFKYDYDYDNDENQPNLNDHNDKQEFKNGKSKYFIIAVILLIVLLVLIFLLVKSCDRNGDPAPGDNEIVLSLSESELTLAVSDTATLQANVNNPSGEVNIQWTVLDEKILSVDQSGNIKGLAVGSTTVVAVYFDSLGNSYEAKCNVSVVAGSGTGVDSQKPVISYKMSSGNGTWTNKDVTITVNATDNNGDVDVKYALNCVSNCQYKALSSNKKIVVSSSGTTVVTIVAKDRDNNEIQKSVTVKIDKTAPKAVLNNSGTTIYGNSQVEVCATCSDNGSGCKKNKVCKTFTSSQTGATIDVLDNASNKASSSKFNVVIDKVKPTCSLSYNNGTLTATTNDTGGSGLKYYGFSSSYSGNNETSKKVSDGTYTYYVKDHAGNTNTCKLVVSTLACSLKFESNRFVSTVTGGSGSYSYSWNDAAYGNATYLSRGSLKAVKLTVKDTNGLTTSCSSTCTFGSWYGGAERWSKSIMYSYSKTEAESKNDTWYRKVTIINDNAGCLEHGMNAPCYQYYEYSRDITCK